MFGEISLFAVFIAAKKNPTFGVIYLSASNGVNVKKCCGKTDTPYFMYLKVNIPFFAMALGIFYTKKYLLVMSLKELITDNKS